MVYPLQSLSYQTLFNAVADAMLLICDTGHIAEANSAALSLLGYTEQEIIDQEFEVLIPQRYQDHYRCYRMAFIQTPELRSMDSGNELSVLTKDGRELKVDIGLSPISIEEQLYILVTFYTLSKRKKVEQALRISEERLRLAKKAAGLSVFDLDAQLSTLNLDEQLYALWGVDPNKSEQYPQMLVVHPKDRALRELAIRQATDPAGNGEFNVEFRIVQQKDDTIHWVSATGRVHFKNGRATRLLGVARNITEQKLLEKKLQDLGAETEALFAKEVATQTAAAIAHELNQPLSAISTYSEVALRALELEEFDSPHLRNALEGCVVQSQRAGASMHELFTFLQKGESIREQLDINDIVKQALIIAKSNGYCDFFPMLQLESKIRPVLANKTQVLKILASLLRNAEEAMREVEIASSKITINVSTNTNMAHITVHDIGLGLIENIAKIIFEPFFSTKPKGIGLGLTISRALAEANGGQLWLDPYIKDGATFHFTLPFAP